MAKKSKMRFAPRPTCEREEGGFFFVLFHAGTVGEEERQGRTCHAGLSTRSLIGKGETGVLSTLDGKSRGGGSTHSALRIPLDRLVVSRLALRGTGMVGVCCMLEDNVCVLVGGQAYTTDTPS